MCNLKRKWLFIRFYSVDTESCFSPWETFPNLQDKISCLSFNKTLNYLNNNNIVMYGHLKRKNTPKLQKTNPGDFLLETQFYRRELLYPTTTNVCVSLSNTYQFPRELLHR